MPKPIFRHKLAAVWTILLALSVLLTAGASRSVSHAQDAPTAIPGQPRLVGQSFQIQPQTVVAGEALAVTFTVTNVGNRIAQDALVTLDTSGKFLPGSSQSAVPLPNLGVDMSFVVAMNVVVASDAPGGPNLMTFKFTYTDFEGKDYEASSTTSVQIISTQQSSQVTVTSYTVVPNPVQPGRAVTLNIEVTNSGTAPAVQALLRVNGGESAVLLAGPAGESFPLGDIGAGETKTLEVVLIASALAKAGPQPQAVTITYQQGGEAKEAVGSLTLTVAQADLQEALLLLENYVLDKETLTPGDLFNMTLTLKNVGNRDAKDLLVTFGTVTETDTTGSSTTTPSTTFAPLGTGGTVYVGDLSAANGTADLTQQFIVDGSVKSGVYGLPVTLRYTDGVGEVKTRSLSASVVVIITPQLRFTDLSPISPEVVANQPVSVALTLINDGKNDVNLRTVTITAENGEVLDGAEQFIGTKKTAEEASINATVMPWAEGAFTITITINYVDELSQPKQIIRTMEANAIVIEEPPIDPEFPIDPGFPEPTPTPEPEPDLLGRFLRGLLGLGSS